MFVRLGKKIKIVKSSDVYFLICSILKRQQPIDRDKEFLFVIGLKADNHIKYVDIVSIGNLKGTIATGREIFRSAVKLGSAAILICHNHPSGNIKPSQNDIELTNRMVEIGHFLDIPVLDHVIVTTDNGYYSFADENLILFNNKAKRYTT
jgi:DNA repair protein RadC